MGRKEVQARADAKRAAYTSRNWAFLIYPENAPEDWLEQLTNLKIRMFISPLHDRDRFTKKDEEQGYQRADVQDTPADGANAQSHLKKAHRHVLIQSTNAHFSYNKLKSICDGINEDAIKACGSPWIAYPSCNIAKVSDFRAYARYLCHIGTKNKPLYDPDDVIALWGLDYTKYVANDETSSSSMNNTSSLIEKVMDELRAHSSDVQTADDAYRYVLREYPHEGPKLCRMYGRVIEACGEGNFLRSLSNSERYEIYESMMRGDYE